VAANRHLKNVVVGAAISAIGQGNNLFSDVYHRLRSQGVSQSNARHAVARKVIDTMVAIWKTGERFQPDSA
jgi:hypothetical protein